MGLWCNGAEHAELTIQKCRVDSGQPRKAVKLRYVTKGRSERVRVRFPMITGSMVTL
jgi:hypothetical protein